jgi:hypothetical protein
MFLILLQKNEYLISPVQKLCITITQVWIFVQICDCFLHIIDYSCSLAKRVGITDKKRRGIYMRLPQTRLLSETMLLARIVIMA